MPVEDMADLEASAGRPRPGGASGGYAEDGEPLGDPARQHSIWPHVEEQVLDLIQAHRSTIVFANSRRLAERLCARLNELAAERAEQRLADAALAEGTALAAARGQPPPPPAEMMAQAGAAPGRRRWWPAPITARCPGRSGPRSRRR